MVINTRILFQFCGMFLSPTLFNIFLELIISDHRYHTVFSSRRILCESWIGADVQKEGSLE